MKALCTVASIAALASLGACNSDSAPPSAPPGGGGGKGGGGLLADAALFADASTKTISAQLCLLVDLRKPSQCDTSASLGGIKVQESSGSGTVVTSDASGRLLLAADPGGGRLHFKIAFGDSRYHNLVVEVTSDATGQISIPLLAEGTWTSLLTTVGVASPDTEAAIVAYVVDATGSPLAGATVIQPAGALHVPLYDRQGGPNDWQSGGLTGNQGAAMLLAVPVTGTQTGFDVSLGAALKSVSNVAIVPGALSFVTVTIP